MVATSVHYYSSIFYSIIEIHDGAKILEGQILSFGQITD